MRIATTRGWLLGAAVLVMYMWLAPPWVVDGDNAELTSLTQLGGIAHPSGYPLLLLWLKATSWLPGSTPAHTAALSTAILGALAVVVLHAACRAWGARPLAATIACAIYAAAPIVMRVATEAEVFALNTLTTATVAWLAARNGPLRGWQRALGLGLVAGLGLSDHLTCVFVAPIGILGVVRAGKECGWRALPLAIGGLALGLTPYLYAFLAPDTPVSWGTVRSLDRLIGHFTRREYGTGELVAHGERTPAGDALGAFAAAAGRAWLYLPALLGLATVVMRLAKAQAAGDARGETRVAWAMWTVSWLVAGPLFVLKFNAPPEGIGLYIVHRFHVLPSLLLAIPVAVGLDSLARFLPERLHAREPLALALVSTLGFAAAAGLSVGRVQALHTAAVETGARNTLGMLPERAVVLEFSDELFFATSYLQWVRGVRQDVTTVAWGMMSLEWYRERVAARGMVADAGPETARVRLITHLLSEGRPVFIEPPMPDVTQTFPTYPYGTLVRVLPRGQALPSIDDVLAENKAIFAKFDLSYPRPSMDDEWATVVHQRYAGTWMSIANLLARMNRPQDADAAAAVANALGPQ